MAIEFSCMNCGTPLRVPEEHAGKRARCPNCQSPNSIPEIAAPAATMAEPVAPVKSPEPNRFSEPVVQNPYAASGGHDPQMQSSSLQGYQAPHRGGLILGLGIASLVCNFMLIPGILAWVLGRSDLQQMRAGHMDRSGEGLTQAGMIMGIILTCIPLAMIVLYLLFIVVVLFIAAIGAAAA